MLRTARRLSSGNWTRFSCSNERGPAGSKPAHANMTNYGFGIEIRLRRMIRSMSRSAMADALLSAPWRGGALMGLKGTLQTEETLEVTDRVFADRAGNRSAGLSGI